MLLENRNALPSKADNPSIQPSSTRNILSVASETDVNLVNLSWLDRGLDLNIQNENSLQEKIISLYEAIEKKTIKNIEMKKNNEVLKGQVDAYLSIIDKIKKASQASKCESSDTMTYQSNRSSRITLKDSQEKEETKTKIQYYQHQNEYNFANQTFQLDLEAPPAKEEMNIHYQPAWESNSVGLLRSQKAENRTPINSITNLRTQKAGSSSKKSAFKQREQQQARWSNYNQSLCSNRDYQLRTQRNQARSPVNLNKKYESNEASNESENPFSRPSIDGSIKKLASPNKSFLKKNSVQNQSTGNLTNAASKYSSIDIESMWNETKSPNKTLENRKMIPRVTSKFQINPMRQAEARPNGIPRVRR